MVPLFSSVPVSHDDSVRVSQHAQYQEPETEATEWNSAIIYFTIYTCAFTTVMCQNVSCGKRLYTSVQKASILHSFVGFKLLFPLRKSYIYHCYNILQELA